MRHDVQDGWCICNEFHGSPEAAGKLKLLPGGESKNNTPIALPCGCRIKNRQGAFICGASAPTQRQPDGTLECRHGKSWVLRERFIEVLR
jgi:hypothetical protein